MEWPIWVQYILIIASVLGALGVIWAKALRPLIRLASSAEEMLPVLRGLTETFKDKPNTFKVLNEIASQFQTDSGSSLRDVVNRLEANSNELAMKLADMSEKAKENQVENKAGQARIIKGQRKTKAE